MTKGGFELLDSATKKPDFSHQPYHLRQQIRKIEVNTQKILFFQSINKLLLTISPLRLVNIALPSNEKASSSHQATSPDLNNYLDPLPLHPSLYSFVPSSQRCQLVVGSINIVLYDLSGSKVILLVTCRVIYMYNVVLTILMRKFGTSPHSTNANLKKNFIPEVQLLLL